MSFIKDNNIDLSSGGKYVYNQEKVDFILSFISKHIKNIDDELAGTEFKLYDWQIEDIIKPIFGWYNKTTGIRKVREYDLFIAKKNGKTTAMAVLLIIFLILDKKENQQYYSIANDGKQAELLFDIVAKMISKDKVLSESLTVHNSFNNKKVINKKTGNIYRPLTDSADSHEGKFASVVICDEIHVYKSSQLYRNLRTSAIKKKEPLLLTISTVGNRKEGFWYDKYTYIKDWLKGININDRYIGIIYAANDNDDISLEETWKKANPSFDAIFAENLAIEYKEALKNAELMIDFKQKHLNLIVSDNAKFLNMKDWDSCIINNDDLSNCDAYLALDLSQKIDFTALACLIVKDNTFNVILKAYQTQRNIDANENYAKWHRQGYVKSAGELTIDYSYILDDIKTLSAKYNIKEIAFDSWNSGNLVPTLSNLDYNCIEISQSFSGLSLATKELQALVVEGKLNHYNNPVLRWMADNVEVLKDNHDNVKPIKSKDRTKKIDGIVALIMALSREMANRVELKEEPNTLPDGWAPMIF